MHRKDQEKISPKLYLFISEIVKLSDFISFEILFSISSVYFHSEYCIILIFFLIDLFVFIITVPITLKFLGNTT